MKIENLKALILDERAAPEIRLDAWDDLVSGCPTPKAIKEVLEKIILDLGMDLWSDKHKSRNYQAVTDIVSWWVNRFAPQTHLPESDTDSALRDWMRYTTKDGDR